jgi:hypothetical protein
MQKAPTNIRWTKVLASITTSACTNPQGRPEVLTSEGTRPKVRTCSVYVGFILFYYLITRHIGGCA